MSRKIKIIIGCIVTVCLTGYLLNNLTNLMERKDSIAKYQEFFEQKEDFDVLFMGTSHVMNGVFPMELWEDYGIVSYNFGGHSNQMATTFWVMENALNYTTPQVVVIDCMTLSENRKCSENFSYVHQSLDCFPLSMTKVKAVWDLLDDPVMDELIAGGIVEDSGEPRTKMGLLWDYSVYHSRWSTIEEEDFLFEKNVEKGAESRVDITKGALNKISSSRKMEAGTVAEDYLRKMIESCQSKGIDVLLTYLPFPANEQQQMEANYVYDIAEEYGINYINFLDMEVIDYQTDLYDEASHLNPSGARKVTEYLGQFLMENYDLPDQRENPEYSFWNEDDTEYNNLKNENLVEQTDMDKYFMLLAGDDVDIIMDIRDHDLFKDSDMVQLLENIGISRMNISENTDFVIVENGGQNIVFLNNFRNDGSSEATSIGNVTLRYSASGENDCSLYVDDVEWLRESSEDEAGLQINVRRGGESIDSVVFTYTYKSESESIKVKDIIRGEKK